MNEEGNDMKEIQNPVETRLSPVVTNKFLVINRSLDREQNAKVRVFKESKEVLGSEALLGINERGFAAVLLLLRVGVWHADSLVNLNSFLG